MNNLLKYVASVALALTMVSTGAFAAPGSSYSSSGGSRPSYSGSSGGYSKPSYTAPSNSYSKPSTPPPSSNSYTKPVLGGAAVGVGAAAAANSYQKPADKAPPASANGYSKPDAPRTAAPAAPPQSRQVSRAESGAALNQYKAQQAAARLPPAAPVSVSQARSAPMYQNVTRVYPTRNVYIVAHTNGWSHYGSIYPGYYMRPSYGIWDAMVFAAAFSAVNNMSNAMWMHSMATSNDAANQAAYNQWRRDMEQKAAEDAQVRAKLAELDAQLAQIKSGAVQVTAPALPVGVDQAMAVAPSTVMADPNEADDDDEGGFGIGTFLFGGLVFAGLGFWFLAWRGRQIRLGNA